MTASDAEPESAAEDQPATATLPFAHAPSLPGTVRRFRLIELEGADPGKSRESRSDRCSIGQHPLNDLALKDPTVSRFHCEIRIEDGRARIRDLESRNGTIVDGVGVVDGFLRDGSELRLGNVLLRFEVGDKNHQLKLAERDSFPGLVGRSTAMRACFSMMERAAESDVTLLLEGETGTGKSAAARAIHAASARRNGPFVVIDCGAIPAPLLESELFGHEKGAFTGADERRSGAFEDAGGGTIFLDEIGELPLELQPKLLRVLEEREVRPLGSRKSKSVDVRIIAATNRDLRVEANAGRFRPDLFYRLAVVRIEVPPLRRRVEDLPELIERLLEDAGGGGAAGERLRDPAHLAELARAAWPGNVRELRNYVERWLFFGEAPMEPPEPSPAAAAAQLDLSFTEARRRALESFERAYLAGQLDRHAGRMKDTAAAAGINRVHLYKILRRLGMK